MSLNPKIEQITGQEFQNLRQLVYDSIGVNLTDAKKSLVISRLSKRLRELELESFSHYLHMLKEDKKELDVLFDLITTNVTKFFREDHHFTYLTQEYLPELEREVEAGGKKKQFKVWSAGCSTGEEPYTLAMVLLDYFEKKKGWDIKILASDINTTTLEKASKGIYTREEVAGIPYSFLPKYFKLGTGVNEGKFKAKDSLQKIIKFRRINLTATQQFPIGDDLNCVFCRNVFIYFDKQTQAKVLQRYHQHLVDAGLLFMGHSESIQSNSGGNGGWKLLKHTVYQKQPLM